VLTSEPDQKMINGAQVPSLCPRTPTQRMSRKPSASSLAFVAGGKKARWAWRKLARVPRIGSDRGVVAILLAVVALTNIVYQVIQKPTELLPLLATGSTRSRPETWRQYGALFRT